MPDIQNIRFKRGVNRYPDVNSGDPSIPFNLHNSRIFHGFVRPVRFGVDTGYTVTGGKPWYSITTDRPGGILTGCPGDTETVTGDWYNDTFYASSCGCADDCSGHITEYPLTWDGTPIDNSESQPRIINLTSDSPDILGSESSTGITPNHYVSYLFIPINDDGSAGEWAYSFLRNPTDKYMYANFTIEANDATEYINVYRSPEKSITTGSPNSNLSLEDQTCGQTQFYFHSEIRTGACEYTLDPVPDPVGVDPAAPTLTAQLDVDSKNETWFWTYEDEEEKYRIAGEDPHNVVGRLENNSLRIYISGIVPDAQDLVLPDVDTIVITSNAHASSTFSDGQEISISEFGVEHIFASPPFGGTLDDGNKGYRYYVDIPDNNFSLQYARDFRDPGSGISIDLRKKIKVPIDDPNVWTFQDRTAIRLHTAKGQKQILPTGETLTRQRNTIAYDGWAQSAFVPGLDDLPTMKPSPGAMEPRGFCAKASLNDAGKMMWGNVRWPTKQPQVSFFDQVGATDVAFQYEYEVGDEKFFGPLTYIDNVSKVMIEPGGGEIAVRVYVKSPGSGVYFLLERIQVGSRGGFGSTCGGCFTFDADSIDANTIYGNPPEPEIDQCISEPSRVFFANGLRPSEVTFQQFSVPGGEEIRHMSSARLAEQEDIKSYSFYVATDKAIYYANRSDVSVALSRVTSLIGVELGIDNHPLWTNSHFGSIFVGTDGHTYYITGRDLIRLDQGIIETPNRGDFFPDLWSTITDIEYHIRFREVWFATDTGVWVYDMGELNPGNRQGIVGQYDFTTEGLENPPRLWYDREDPTNLPGTGFGNMMIIFDPLPLDATDQPILLAVDLGTYMNFPSVTTGRIMDSTRSFSVERVSTAFEPMPTDRLPSPPQGTLAGAGYDPLTMEIDGRDAVYTNTANNQTFPSQPAKVIAQTIRQVEPYTPVYPRVGSRGERITFVEFEELRVAELMLIGNPKER